MTLTIFTVPKPFVGHIGVIQSNAIRSWTLLRPKCQIVLFGDDLGVAQAAREFDVLHVRHVRRNEFGTPRLDDVFQKASERATSSLLCYVNADIILFDDLLAAVQRVRHKRFLMLGQRWDLNLDRPWDFARPDWDSALRADVGARGVLHPPTGCDYYVFPPALFKELPPFAIGRSAYDNWFIWHARRTGAAVIDTSRVVMAIHQNHERTYSSVGTTPPPGEEDSLLRGVEAKRNFELAGGRWHMYTVRNANWVMHKRWLLPAVAPSNLVARLKRWDFRL